LIAAIAEACLLVLSIMPISFVGEIVVARVQ